MLLTEGEDQTCLIQRHTRWAMQDDAAAHKEITSEASTLLSSAAKVNRLFLGNPHPRHAGV